MILRRGFLHALSGSGTDRVAANPHLHLDAVSCYSSGG